VTILCGHSSGANISLLSALDIPSRASGNATSNPVDMFLGLCGVYDVYEHYLYESKRGVQNLSPMAAAAGIKHDFYTHSLSNNANTSESHICSTLIAVDSVGSGPSDSTHQHIQHVSMLHACSPTHILSQHTSSSTSSSVVLPKKMVFLHGSNDRTVPVHSSANVAKIIDSNSLSAVSTYHPLVHDVYIYDAS
jgi:alpha-beta hydrolase superfamily lysophospholipase